MSSSPSCFNTLFAFSTEERFRKVTFNWKELKKTFRPEFLNRIDGVVVFHSLTKEQIRQIVDLMLSLVAESLGEKNIKLEITDAAKDFLVTQGVSEGRMSTISYGEERPLDSGSSEEAWAKNRNDQFVLVK